MVRYHDTFIILQVQCVNHFNMEVAMVMKTISLQDMTVKRNVAVRYYNYNNRSN